MSFLEWNDFGTGFEWISYIVMAQGHKLSGMV